MAGVRYCRSSFFEGAGWPQVPAGQLGLRPQVASGEWHILMSVTAASGGQGALCCLLSMRLLLFLNRKTEKQEAHYFHMFF